MAISARVQNTIKSSDYLSRDLSWLKFNERVLDQVADQNLSLFERLKFLAITASNLDEFLTIRLGSLYNYLDYGKERIDYSGLREQKYREVLLKNSQDFCAEQDRIFGQQLLPLFQKYKFRIVKFDELEESEKGTVIKYFDETVYPMLTPMLFDHTHVFPALIGKAMTFGVVTDANRSTLFPTENDHKLSFVQLPSNLTRFFVFERGDETLFLPIEEIVRSEIKKLYRNVEIVSVNLFRIIRNGDFVLDESDDIEADFVKEIKQKIKSRRLGRVVHMEIEKNPSTWMLDQLKEKWEIDDFNIYQDQHLIDYTGLWQIIRRPEFSSELLKPNPVIDPIGISPDKSISLFEQVKERDILLHHPYNNFEPVIQMLEAAAEDPNVLSIKLTIYRLAKKSRVTAALLKAAENNKTVSVLFEIKARFDEENNIREAEKLQRAGCFVIYGIGWYKTHTKLMLIVRNEGNRVVQYAHLASGNYNEDTAKLYTDIGLLTSKQDYTQDISEFFNVITGHSQPEYKNLITSPFSMRNSLVAMIRNEAENAAKGLKAGICIKLNSLEDKTVIDELYEASNKGVSIRLIIRGICCLRPGRAGMSENIQVRSIVGHFLEHARIFYFQNHDSPRIFGGSADAMVRSFDKRIESLFELIDTDVKKQAVGILNYNWLDNVNSYQLQEDGNYRKLEITGERINIHEKFFDRKLKFTETELDFKP